MERIAAGAIVSAAFRVSRIQYQRQPLSMPAGRQSGCKKKEKNKVDGKKKGGKKTLVSGRSKLYRNGRCAKCQFQKRDSNLAIIGAMSYNVSC